ncbi:MAG TPA: fibrobacter succinogenes major paralogous domain-containing protein [Ferruginibacter sp.]|nr:fibrobacter succinogenes major paralogous domain-containing protein [Ferruginibacter sp.]
MKKYIALALLVVIFDSCKKESNNNAVPTVSVTDAVPVTDTDGNTYSTVQIGSQVWITSNLNVSHFRNGDEIPEIEDSAAWVQAASANEVKPAWCYYNSDPANGKIYGKLYNWYAVIDSRGLAPAGWHIPSDTEWSNLITYLGGESVAGVKMKSTNGWYGNGNGTNKSGFAGLPGGARYGYDGSLPLLGGAGAFYSIGQIGCWWSSSQDGDGPYGAPYGDDDTFGAFIYDLDYADSSSFYGNSYENCGFSVRCLRD